MHFSCFVLESHHIDQRILEDADESQQTKNSEDGTNLGDFDLPPPSRLADIRANCTFPANFSDPSTPIRPECLMRSDSSEIGPGKWFFSAIDDWLIFIRSDGNNGQGVDTEVADLLDRNQQLPGKGGNGKIFNKPKFSCRHSGRTSASTRAGISSTYSR